MTLVRYTPFENRINRFFNDACFAPFETDLRCNKAEAKWNPVVDIYEDKENIVIKSDLPGIKKQDISIDIKDRVLTLKGERVFENEVKEKDFFRRERSYGKFKRAFSVASNIKVDDILAEFKDGVLKIDIPKPEEAKSNQININ